MFEHVSSSDVSATDSLYCSVYSLTRIKHVGTGEYMVAANKISSKDNDNTLTESSIQSGGGDNSSTHGSEGVDDDDNDDDGGDDDGTDGVIESGDGGSRKERPMGTVAVVPDESVFQMSAVAPTDVDNCFIVQGLSYHIVAFIEYTQEVETRALHI